MRLFLPLSALKVRIPASARVQVQNPASASAHHRAGLRGALWLGSVLRTAGPVLTVRPTPGSPGTRSPGRARDVLPARRRHARRIFRYRWVRIFLPAEALETLVSELTIKYQEGILCETLSGLRCLYGDL